MNHFLTKSASACLDSSGGLFRWDFWKWLQQTGTIKRQRLWEASFYWNISAEICQQTQSSVARFWQKGCLLQRPLTAMLQQWHSRSVWVYQRGASSLRQTGLVVLTLAGTDVGQVVCFGMSDVIEVFLQCQMWLRFLAEVLKMHFARFWRCVWWICGIWSDFQSVSMCSCVVTTFSKFISVRFGCVPDEFSSQMWVLKWCSH